MDDDKKNINNIGEGLGDELEEVQVEQIIKSTMGEETDNEPEEETENEPEEETDNEP